MPRPNIGAQRWIVFAFKGREQLRLRASRRRKVLFHLVWYQVKPKRLATQQVNGQRGKIFE
jgi:hypothetical protein